MIPSRRRFLFGAGALLAAPAIVRVSSLMAVKPLPMEPADQLLPGGLINSGEFTVQYVQEFLRGFEARQSLLRRVVTTESCLTARTRIGDL